MIESISMGGVTARRLVPAVVSRPPMLFVHGYFVDGSVFDLMMRFHADRGHACYAVNLRGRAGSRPGTDVGRASLRDFADDAEVMARALGEPIVVGHSMGGLVAQLVAERGLARALVLLAPAPPRGISITTARLIRAQIGYLPALLRSRPVVARLGDLAPLAFNRVPAGQLSELAAGLVPDSGVAGREMAFLGVPVDRSRVRVPVLTIGGDEDRFIPIDRVARVAERYGTRVRVAKGRGHMLILEPGWEEIAEWIEAWLEALPPASHLSPVPTTDR